MAAVARNFHLVDGLLCTRMARFLSKSRFNRYSVKKKKFRFESKMEWHVLWRYDSKANPYVRTSAH